MKKGIERVRGGGERNRIHQTKSSQVSLLQVLFLIVNSYERNPVNYSF